MLTLTICSINFSSEASMAEYRASLLKVEPINIIFRDCLVKNFLYFYFFSIMKSKYIFYKFIRMRNLIKFLILFFLHKISSYK